MELEITNYNFTISLKIDGKEYEVITCESLAEELETSRPTINGYTYNLDPKTKETRLDFCYPHKTVSNKGPKYVIKNAKYDSFVSAYLARKRRRKSKNRV